MLGRVTVNMKDSPARIDPGRGRDRPPDADRAPLGRGLRQPEHASVSPNTPPSAPNTRLAYAGALRRVDAWLDGRELDDVGAGRLPCRAARCRPRFLERVRWRSPRRASARSSLASPLLPVSRPPGVLAGYRRTAYDRGRGQARPVRGLRKSRTWRPCFATCCRPRRRGRGGESDQVAIERGRVDAVIAGLLFMAGMRRSEVSALCWVDVVDSTDGDGMTRHRATEQDEPGGRGERRAVREGRRSARPPHAAHLHESGAGRPRRAVVGADDRVAVHGRGAGRRHREPGDGALGPGRTRVGAHEPGRIDHGRDARGQLEDQPHVAHLLCRGDGGTRCSRTLSL